jgi:hypothetical protein
MALKADRYEESTDISFFYNAGTATRGGVVLIDAANASGAAMDQGANLVQYSAATTGTVPVGILLNDVVNKDLTRTHLNQYKDEVQKGGKVTVMTRGWVVTNSIDAVTIVPGEVAYASASNAGNLTNVSTAGQAVGRFMSQQDSDGYAKVYVNLPLA